jgi:hypothetical protein
MKSIDNPVHSLRSEERKPGKMPCFVVWKGRTVRRINIENFSKQGLLLRGSAALYLDVCIGDRMLVYTTFGHAKMCLDGVVARTTRDTELLIGLRDVKWYDGWPSAHSVNEEVDKDQASPDQITEAPDSDAADPET